jgi:hypothetical protein
MPDAADSVSTALSTAVAEAIADQIIADCRGNALPAAKLNTATEYELDIALRDLRERIAADKGTSDIDFYDDTLKPQWQIRPGIAPIVGRLLAICETLETLPSVRSLFGA